MPKIVIRSTYLKQLRSPLKRAYALKYVEWMDNGQQGLEPDKGDLSTMAAQGVRMSLRSEEQD